MIRTTQGAPGSRILAVGAYRPERVVTNDEICQFIDSSDQWIRERTGIISRRFGRADETPVTMGIEAGRKALAASGVAPQDIDMVLFATVTHMVQTPAAAPMVADALGLTPAAAYDISAACSGFCHALGTADALIRAGAARHVLVLGGDKMTDIIDPTDRGVAFIFADGVGAVVVGATDEPAIGPTIWGSDGGQSQLITQNHPWPALRANDAGGEEQIPYPSIVMEGRSVFRWSVFQMPAVAHQAVEAAGLTMDDLAAFIPHQANNRIIEAMVKQLKLPEHVVVSHDVITSGNTTAGTIVLAMDALLKDHPELSGQPALLIGFGAGLAYAAQVVRLP